MNDFGLLESVGSVAKSLEASYKLSGACALKCGFTIHFYATLPLTRLI